MAAIQRPGAAARIPSALSTSDASSTRIAPSRIKPFVPLDPGRSIARYGHDVTPLFRGDSGGQQRAAMGSRFHDHDCHGKAADDSICIGNRHGSGCAPGGNSVMSAPRPRSTTC